MESMTDAVQYRQAHSTDLHGVGEVFLAAFPESVHHYVGHAIPPTVVSDLYALLLASEPEAFFVAELDGRIVGYIFAPTQLSRVADTARRSGAFWRMAWRWVTGQYGFGLHPVWISLRNALSFLHDVQHDDPSLACDTRIFSVAVHPDAQGHGIGKGLMQRGLAYLAAQRVPCIRLEVRPQNMPAVHLYESLGFVTRGSTHDTQGEWLVMLKENQA